MNAFASHPAFEFLANSSLSDQSKLTLDQQVTINCVNVTRLIEISTEKIVNSAPEDTFSFYTTSTFQVKGLFDGTHPTTEWMTVTFKEEKIDQNIWNSSLDSIDYKGSMCSFSN